MAGGTTIHPLLTDLHLPTPPKGAAGRPLDQESSVAALDGQAAVSHSEPNAGIPVTTHINRPTFCFEAITISGFPNVRSLCHGAQRVRRHVQRGRGGETSCTRIETATGRRNCRPPDIRGGPAIGPAPIRERSQARSTGMVRASPPGCPDRNAIQNRSGLPCGAYSGAYRSAAAARTTQ